MYNRVGTVVVQRLVNTLSDECCLLEWRRHIRLKCQFIINPHGATSQKMAFFIITEVKTSNLTTASLLNVIYKVLFYIVTDFQCEAVATKQATI
jgi:hypothetical protein